MLTANPWKDSMGSSASADIIYGFASPEKELIPDKDDDSYEPIFDHYDWEEEFYHRIGKPYPGWSHDYSKAPELREAGCKIGTHGYSDGDEGLYLGIIDSHLHSDWDSIAEIDPLHFAQTPETIESWKQKLQAFCKLMSIPYQEPKWLMVCSY